MPPASRIRRLSSSSWLRTSDSSRDRPARTPRAGTRRGRRCPPRSRVASRVQLTPPNGDVRAHATARPIACDRVARRCPDVPGTRLRRRLDAAAHVVRGVAGMTVQTYHQLAGRALDTRVQARRDDAARVVDQRDPQPCSRRRQEPFPGAVRRPPSATKISTLALEILSSDVGDEVVDMPISFSIGAMMVTVVIVFIGLSPPETVPGSGSAASRTPGASGRRPTSEHVRPSRVAELGAKAGVEGDQHQHPVAEPLFVKPSTCFCFENATIHGRTSPC